MDTWGVEINQIEENKVKCDISFTTLKNNEVFEFDYKGKEETISLSSGRYKLEVWGAQGGKINVTGGYGGYSVGEITLDSSTVLYINVGGKGAGYGSGIRYGGYNGGGNGNCSQQVGTGGGGATHIAKVSGLLSTLENKKNDILIVAGGGGGNGNQVDSVGGSGGGITGNNGLNNDTTSNTTNYTGTGGTQSTGGKYYGPPKVSDETTNGSFGQGGNNYDELASCGNIGCGGSGGGGGFYGGGGSGRGHSGAGGGSGYIGNTLLKNKSMYCYECETSEAEDTKTVSIETTNEKATSQVAKIGNGYAKITYLGNS